LPERFADMAGTVAHLLVAVAAPERVGITTPDDLSGLLPFVRVTRSGGPRDRINDFARLAVDVFADDYDGGFALAEDIAAFLEPGRLIYGPVVIDRVAVDSAPQEVAPWAPGIFRFEAAYTVVSRRHRGA
jgi:hypothetical protein